MTIARRTDQGSHRDGAPLEPGRVPPEALESFGHDDVDDLGGVETTEAATREAAFA